MGSRDLTFSDRPLTTSGSQPPPAAPVDLGKRGRPGLPPQAEIGIDELLSTPQAVVVDVRTHAEFGDDHYPGARSVPLFSDRERAVVGTLFRHHGEGAARDWGEGRVRARLEEYSAKLVAALALDRHPGTSTVDPLKPRVVLCSRGGQRSEAVVRLLRDLGHPVLRLRGGYRSYRSRIRERSQDLSPPGPVVLNGLTGSGKTLILRSIAARFSQRVVDLEGLAGHRSSLLGDIGLMPVSQKAFESSLVHAIARLEGPWTLFEWVARRIGNRELPQSLYERLKDAPQIALDNDLERRIDLLCAEYLGPGGVREIQKRLPGLARYPAIGEVGVARLIADLDCGRVREVARFLLERHYDPRYRFGNKRLPAVKTFVFRSVEETAEEILKWLEARH